MMFFSLYRLSTYIIHYSKEIKVLYSNNEIQQNTYLLPTYIDKKNLGPERNMDYSPTFGSCKVGLDLRVQNWVKLGRFGLQGKNLILVGLIGN